MLWDKRLRARKWTISIGQRRGITSDSVKVQVTKHQNFVIPRQVSSMAKTLERRKVQRSEPLIILFFCVINGIQPKMIRNVGTVRLINE